SAWVNPLFSPAGADAGRPEHRWSGAVRPAWRAEPRPRGPGPGSGSGVAEGEELGDRGPVAGGAGGGRAGGPAQQEQGKLAAAEPVRGVHVQGGPDDLGGVLPAAPLRGPPLPRLDGFGRPRGDRAAEEYRMHHLGVRLVRV